MAAWLCAAAFRRGHSLNLGGGLETAQLCFEKSCWDQGVSRAAMILEGWRLTAGEKRGLKHAISYPSMVGYRFWSFRKWKERKKGRKKKKPLYREKLNLWCDRLGLQVLGNQRLAASLSGACPVLINSRLLIWVICTRSRQSVKIHQATCIVCAAFWTMFHTDIHRHIYTWSIFHI